MKPHQYCTQHCLHLLAELIPKLITLLWTLLSFSLLLCSLIEFIEIDPRETGYERAICFHMVGGGLAGERVKEPSLYKTKPPYSSPPPPLSHTESDPARIRVLFPRFFTGGPAPLCIHRIAFALELVGKQADGSRPVCQLSASLVHL